MMTERELLDLKQEIDQAKESFQQLKGQEKAILQQLKDDFDCSTFEQTNKKTRVLEKEISKLSDEIEQGVSELEKLLSDETD